jgi:hypothetical protein
MCPQTGFRQGPHKSAELLNCHPEWTGNHVAFDKFVGTLALEQSIVSYCDRNALLHFLNFVRLHRATEHE